MVLAAGGGSRFGGAKHLAPVGPAGEALLDYAIHDAVRAGVGRVVLVERPGGDPGLEAHITGLSGDAVRVVRAEQRLDDLPRGLTPPVGRSRPWGTAHALFAARRQVTSPFLVCNADDYYGPGAFRLLAEHLSRPGDDPVFAGYRLDQTLSEHGSVSRALARMDGHGFLTALEELVQVGRDPETGLIEGRRMNGESIRLAGSELVSMNLWGFFPAVFAALEAQLAEFLAARGGEPEAEFQLSQAIGAQVEAGESRVRVVGAPDRWFGITFAADMPRVREAIAALVGAGLYPRDLRSAPLRTPRR